MHDYVLGLIGGVLLGLAALVVRLGIGVPLGISGFLSKALSFRPKVADWRLAFLAGMALVALLLPSVYPVAISEVPSGGLGLIALAGLLVGAGARFAGGCTSGHSLCGMGNLEGDSIVATVVFIASGAATVFLMGGGLG
ncbi:YeeE/YedE family protein [Pelagicoccus mobilis]|uniref:YeeE/YedE family protein n=1 Tax=Pelagicoccus mobilis TaxID=415221 RepID=A0A934S613_9BACT|nr:YeeE/YedE thiosulfate transporter family protein [Pelagicoccus mobilis]MBK1880407.1 hypothetical protein [Pelagicoccus mobilis]